MTDTDGDVVWGASKIGEVINRPPRPTYHMLEQGLLPAKKIGGRWVSSRKSLLEAVLIDERAS